MVKWPRAKEPQDFNKLLKNYDIYTLYYIAWTSEKNMDLLKVLFKR